MNDASSPNEESRYLWASAGGNLLIGCVGITFAHLASSQAILLDGLFNLSYFVTGLFTLKVAALVRQGDDRDFPLGYAYFEPLINGLKGLLVLGLTAMAVVDAIASLLTGGRTIAAGMAVGYGVFATVACGTLAYIVNRGARRTQSPLIQADAENWVVNAAISSAVLLAFIAIPLMSGTRLEPYAPYVDPVLVLMVAGISISVPVRMAWGALMELLNRAPAPKIINEVRRIIQSATKELPVQNLFVRVVQPGRTRIAIAHVILPVDCKASLAELDAVQEKAQSALQEAYAETTAELIFTSDPDRGAPLSIQT
jgi:cation diffusion facilitator family transporter